MMTTLPDWLNRLEPKIGQWRGQTKAEFRCPAHDDKKASAAAILGADEWWHLNCQCGCTEEAIMAAIGIEHRDRCMKPPHSRAQRTQKYISYVYTDLKKQPLLKKVRVVENKNFFIQHWNEEERKWDKGLGKFPPGKIIYNAPLIRSAINAGKEVWICEGEKACDALARYDIAASCQIAGAGPGKFTPDHARYFRGGRVCIVADIDEVGEAYATEVATILIKEGCQVRIVQSATGEPHHDAYDHLVNLHPIEAFVSRPDLIPPEASPLGAPVWASRIGAPRPVTPMWGTRIVRGKPTLLDASDGVGKTTVMLAIAASFSRGVMPYDGLPLPGGPTRTLYVHRGEDSDEEIKEVFVMLGGIPEMLEIRQDFPDLRPKYVNDIVGHLRLNEHGFVVYDPLMAFTGWAGGEGNDASAVQPTITSLLAICEQANVASVSIRHTGKNRNAGIRDRGVGSAMLPAGHRGHVVIDYCTREDRRGYVLIDTKGSLRYPTSEPVGFRKTSSGLEWVDVGIVNPCLDDDEYNAALLQREAILKRDFDEVHLAWRSEPVPPMDYVMEMVRRGHSANTARRYWTKNLTR